MFRTDPYPPSDPNEWAAYDADARYTRALLTFDALRALWTGQVKASDAASPGDLT